MRVVCSPSGQRLTESANLASAPESVKTDPLLPTRPEAARGLALRHNPEQPQRRPPFDVPIWHVHRLVQPLQVAVKPLVLLALPLVGRRIAEEHAAAERPDRMDAAQTGKLHRTAGSIPRPAAARLQLPWPASELQLMHERRQLDRRDVKAMAKLLEPAAP